MNKILIKRNKHIHTVVLLLGFMLFFLQLSVYAQEQPPRPLAIYVSPIQSLSFGSVILGSSGGTVIVYPDGTRSSTGDIILGDFGHSYSPALFEIETNIGTLISVVNGPDAILTGSNGGTMTLKIDSSYPISPFVTTESYPNRTYLRIGGTLIVGNSLANPEGSYSGSFVVTFIQE
jgi:hypothetical protein